LKIGLSFSSLPCARPFFIFNAAPRSSALLVPPPPPPLCTAPHHSPTAGLLLARRRLPKPGPPLAEGIFLFLVILFNK
jgi:hypothetical protein